MDTVAVLSDLASFLSFIKTQKEVKDFADGAGVGAGVNL